MGICEVLTLIFIVLKLTDKISWNWFFVLLPEVIAFTFYLGIFIALNMQNFRVIFHSIKRNRGKRK